jgi:hypothetical protein
MPKAPCRQYDRVCLGHTAGLGGLQDQWAVHQLDCSAVTSPAAVLRFLPDPERTSGAHANPLPMQTLTALCLQGDASRTAM